LKILNFNEASADGGFSRRTLERLCEAGEGPPVVQLSARRKALSKATGEIGFGGRRKRPPGEARQEHLVRKVLGISPAGQTKVAGSV
jgi:hypothetical protein